MDLTFQVVLCRRAAEPMACCDCFVVVPVNSFQSFSFDLTVRFPRAGHALDRQRFKTKKKKGAGQLASAVVPQKHRRCARPSHRSRRSQNTIIEIQIASARLDGMSTPERLFSRTELAPSPLTFASRARYLCKHSKENAHVHPN